MSSAASILSVFQKDSIIPDIIPASEKFNPSVFFSVIPPVKTDAFVNGAEVPREETLGQPEIVFAAADRTKTYTVVMTDPDVPSRAAPELGEFRHWLITGLKASGGSPNKAIKTKPSSTSYFPPSPPAGSGLHRYAFLLFEEPASGVTIASGAPEGSSEVPTRYKWNAMEFAKKHGLKLVGATYISVRALPA